MAKESILFSARLELVPATLAILQADLCDRVALARLLDARVPEHWPPPLVDATALEWSIKSLETDPNCLLWLTRYFVLKEPRVLIGLGGFKGRPDARGMVEIGYSVVEPFQRRGYGTEAAAALCAWAFSHAQVRCVIAETLPQLTASISVLRKNQFRLTGVGSEEGTIRYELPRAGAVAGFANLK